jgi:hypothetical protein
VEWETEGNAAIVDRRDCLIYLQDASSLRTPFSIAVKGSDEGDGPERLCPGDLLYKEGDLIYRFPDRAWSVDVSCPILLDLNRSLAAGPDRAVRSEWADLLLDKICSSGNFQGLAGLLVSLSEIARCGQHRISRLRASELAQYALGPASLLIEGVVGKNLDAFSDGWNKLVGLGPGFTPAGDDFLVGFLAAHRVFSSTLWESVLLPDERKRLAATLPATSPLSTALLRSGLEGSFSEIIFDLFEALLFDKKTAPVLISRLLQMGHTSGTDLLTGIILGLETI